MELAIEHGLVLEGTEADRWNLDGLEQLLELPASEEICTRILHA
ncbi:hypothetical protein [Kocuria turfanensis]|uniref:Uncharacterized protein n=1 Tax=Kocuria turfanensis TaxID=388357 RepID=A0A512IH51_9MICC|nr:hypothetical protein [Kocuria turfanensis]GEO97032.1 hypothetical protein KTU01_31550 [Kocuria turfanensis]